MEQLERKQVISSLEEGWGSYVQRYQALPPDAQADFLVRQGYARLGDLLAHVGAWWELAREKLAQKQSGASAAPVSIDVDQFNAQAVARVSQVAEAELIDSFRDQLDCMLSMVRELPEEIFAQPDVQKRLRVEIIEHLEEHRLP